jgi:hypothetical protein
MVELRRWLQSRGISVTTVLALALAMRRRSDCPLDPDNFSCERVLEISALNTAFVRVPNGRTFTLQPIAESRERL